MKKLYIQSNLCSESASSGQNNGKIKFSFKRVLFFILKAAIIFLVVLSLIITLYLIGNNDSKDYNKVSPYDYGGDDLAFTNSNIQKALLEQGNLVKVVAKVEAFSYDNSNGNKYLQLKVDSHTIDAIIFKETEVPYINKGEIYTFRGMTGEYDGQITFRITWVE